MDMGTFVSRGQRHFYALAATLFTLLLADDASAQLVLVDQPMNWLKENIMAFINNDIWAWVALGFFLWQMFQWLSSRRIENIVYACGAGIFGIVWAARGDILGAWGIM
jgi:hypothetical protein